MWDKDVFNTYKAFNPVPVEACNSLAYIVLEGQIKQKLNKQEVIITCRHVPDFNENVVAFL